MNSKFYVSLEAEELLMEKGYPIEKDAPICNKYGDVIGCYPADIPTKAEAIDWLESKEMRINIIYDWIECKWYFTIINGSPTVKNITELEVSDSVFYKTRLEAEEAAIIKALSLL